MRSGAGIEGFGRNEDIDEASSSGIGRASLVVPGPGDGAYVERGTIVATVDDPAAGSLRYGGQEKFQT